MGKGKINLRHLLAGTAALTVVAPTTVGILANVDQSVYNITATNFTIQTTAGNDPKSINNQITAKFIKDQLDGDVKDTFKENLFHFNKVMIGNKVLAIKDLKDIKTFNALINYNYGSITGVTTNLTITVTEPDPIEANIVNEINKVEYTLNNIPIKTTVNQVKAKIDDDFIKEQLTNNAKANFDNSLFKLNQITETGHDLEDSRLQEAQTLFTKIHYDYGNIKDQETVLTIEVVGIDDEQIAFAIREASYQQEVVVNSKESALEKLIDPAFIQEQLPEKIKTAFNWVLLSFDENKITINDNKLTDEDLLEAKTIEAKIHYNYGQYQGYSTNLLIIVK